jgi:two-component system sensor histidine kinase/response regulator
MLDLRTKSRSEKEKRIVLIIDDERPIRRMIGRILQLDSFWPVEADNAADGIALARQYRPDLVICDVIMDRADGYSVLEAMRSEQSLASVPFIFMTGTADNAGLRRGMKMGADDYLAKPFSGAELRETVAAHVRKQELLASQSEKRLAELRTNINMALPHELLTPLNGIMGFAELLKICGDETPLLERQNMAASICDSAERLQHLIENYLVFAQIELLANDDAKISALRETICEDANDVIRATAEGTAQRHGRERSLRIRAEAAPAHISQEHLKKIVEELVSNACKFSKSTELIEVVSWKSGECFVLGVRDRGHGMTAEQISNVGAFMQFDRRLFEQQGLGFGLHICRRLVELHGGELRIMSQPGQGTEVVVTLRAA